MRKFLCLAAFAGVLGLAACSGSDLSRTFGLTRDAPDEFQVTTRAPLSMPPNFNLPPPQPGAPRPQELTPRQQAEAALVPGSINAQPGDASLSPGEQALVQESGPPAPANIRAEVNSDASLTAENPNFVDRLMFWRSPTPPGTVVDPVRESQRLQQNEALGQSVETGDTPIIQSRHQGLFMGLF
jgi:hypothetical protein